MVEIRVFSVLWGLVQPLGFSQKGEVCPLYPVFHPTSIHSGQIPGFPVGPGMGHMQGVYLELKLGCKVSTRKDLTCIEFNN
jgi:hypothetical protein